MGTVLSCASVPSSPSNGNAFETETYRIRQLDARYRKKAVIKELFNRKSNMTMMT